MDHIIWPISYGTYDFVEMIVSFRYSNVTDETLLDIYKVYYPDFVLFDYSITDFLQNKFWVSFLLHENDIKPKLINCLNTRYEQPKWASSKTSDFLKISCSDLKKYNQ